jgi:hypothetical protein
MLPASTTNHKTQALSALTTFQNRFFFASSSYLPLAADGLPKHGNIRSIRGGRCGHLRCQCQRQAIHSLIRIFMASWGKVDGLHLALTAQSYTWFRSVLKMNAVDEYAISLCYLCNTAIQLAGD